MVDLFFPSLLSLIGGVFFVVYRVLLLLFSLSLLLLLLLLQLLLLLSMGVGEGIVSHLGKMKNEKLLWTEFWPSWLLKPRAENGAAAAVEEADDHNIEFRNDDATENLQEKVAFFGLLVF